MMNAGDIPNGCRIVNIRRGKGDRWVYVYADLIGPDGELLICATIDYIATALMERLQEADQ